VRSGAYVTHVEQLKTEEKKDMKNFLKIFLAVTLVGLMAAPTYAVIQNFGPRSSERVAPPAPQAGDLLFDEMIDKPITNTENQQLGSVDSLLFDESGRVSYIIISPAPGIKTFGQMVAVPWNAANPSLQDGQVFVSLTRQQLVNAPGIPSNNIAQLQNPQMQQQVNAYFGTSGAPSGIQRDMGVWQYYREPEIGVGTGGFYDSGQLYRYRRSRPDRYGGPCGARAWGAPVGPAPQGFEPMGRMHNVRVDSLIGQPVINQNGERLGILDDLLISQNGQIRFIIIIPRGQSTELVMIPWSVAQPTVETDRLIVSMSQDQFNSAQRFARSRFGRLAIQPNTFGYYGEDAGTFPIRANAVIGEQLSNFQGQELGVIKDLTTNRAGCLKFAILSPAKNLQMGDKLVAVPWSLIQTNPERNRLMADISPQELQNAPTFTTENWRQQITNPQFDQDVCNYYSVQPDACISMRAPFMQSGLMRASHLLGETVITPDGQILGILRDMTTSDSGQISYLLISQQIAPGQIVAVPWGPANPTMQQNQLAINVSQDEFGNAPSFAMSNWRYLNLPRFENRVNSYFGPGQRQQLPSANQGQDWGVEEIEIY
jgi:sporulation protein YlmC with PRC-barrel domain